MIKIQSIGTIAKQGYCNKCFSIVKWDKPDVEITTLGNKYVVCPKCGGHVDVKEATIDYSNTLKNIGITVNGVAYESAKDILMDLTSIEANKIEITLSEDVILTSAFIVPKEKEVTIDLGGNKITTPSAISVRGDLVIDGKGSIESSARVLAANGGTITLKDGTIKSTTDCAIDAYNHGTVNIEGGLVDAQEFGVLVTTGGILNITGGKLVTHDNAVCGGNGSPGQGDTVINISGGELISNIQSAGYVACGVYSPNTGTVNITGGKITANNGAGVVARGGRVNISGGEIIATGDIATTGKVGDSRIVVPCSGVVYDKDSKYPGQDSLNVKITGGKITGAKSAIEILTNEEKPKIKIINAILNPPLSI